LKLKKIFLTAEEANARHQPNLTRTIPGKVNHNLFKHCLGLMEQCDLNLEMVIREENKKNAILKFLIDKTMKM